jgi:hypothetical protein
MVFPTVTENARVREASGDDFLVGLFAEVRDAERRATWRRQRERAKCAELMCAVGPRENRAPRFGERCVNDDMIGRGA